ncbi:uncharacterized protein [Vicugna pacos]|uniref:Uncharacterized protein isoform X2 n=1 Tax=Vicugna pacos TaxID=30538 RepID=A0ABM5C8T2_VICPA
MTLAKSQQEPEAFKNTLRSGSSPKSNLDMTTALNCSPETEDSVQLLLNFQPTDTELVSLKPGKAAVLVATHFSEQIETVIKKFQPQPGYRGAARPGVLPPPRRKHSEPLRPGPSLARPHSPLDFG